MLDPRKLEIGGVIVRVTNILDLNIFCIQRIFDYLSVKDFISVAQINERFKSNAQSVVPIKYNSFELKIPEYTWKVKSTERQTANLLTFFGLFINKLVIYGEALMSSG